MKVINSMRIVLILPVVWLLACSDSEPEADVGQVRDAPTTNFRGTEVDEQAIEEPASHARQIYDAWFEEWLELNPLQATYIGDHRYDDRLPNFLSAEHRRKERELHQRYLDQILTVDATTLEGQDSLSFSTFVRDRKIDLEGFTYPDELLPINQFYNIANTFAQLGSGEGAQPFGSAEDYRNWLSRVDGFVVVMDQAIANMETGISRSITQPRVLMEKVIPQLEAHLVDDPRDSIFFRPISNLPESVDAAAAEELETRYLAAIDDKIIPAYRRLRDFIRDEYLPEARDTHGMWDLPLGDRWYAYKVRRITTTDMDPELIHQLGLEEVRRIHSEIRYLMDDLGYTGTINAFFDHTRSAEEFRFASEAELLAAYRELRATIERRVPELFEHIPEADFEIRPVEVFRQQSASAASYQRPAADASRPGIFYVNTYDLSARPRWAVESLFLHEAIPGHHYQISIQQELDDLPDFRRFGGETAFIEGWGLYAEALGDELGVYDEPYAHYGALAAELWRAIRLVVDTGIHAKKWTRQQVLDYMYANAPVAEARAVSEAERFMAIPGQALAYKIGQMKIQELRERAQRQLGDRFQLREFHTAVLESGALPLDVLEQKIDRWIVAQQEGRG